MVSHAPLILDDVARSVLTRVAVHLASGHRLNRRLTQLSEVAPVEAVFRADGRLEHAEGPAACNAARDELCDAAMTQTRVRSDPRGESLRSIALWRSVVSGRWTLSDKFERDGTRYVVARENRPVTFGLEALSMREREIAALALLGRSNKVIAYELGLAHATVRVLLARACRKLGVRTRVALLALLAQDFIVQPHSANQSSQ